LLICNLRAINLKSPQTISNVIRQDLEEILIQVTRNRDLSMIFTEQSRQLDKEFFQYLMASRSCHPRILHEIFRNPVQGTKMAYLSKYKNNKTVI
jgi:hypothetical protein